MLDPVRTNTDPEVAPAGIVKTIAEALQTLVVMGTPFIVTMLLPSEVPKFAPESATWVPIEPVVAEKLEMTGAGCAFELTDTLSKVAVLRVEVEPLFTDKPT